MGADSSKHTREPLSDTTIQKLVSDFKFDEIAIRYLYAKFMYITRGADHIPKKEFSKLLKGANDKLTDCIWNVFVKHQRNCVALNFNHFVDFCERFGRFPIPFDAKCDFAYNLFDLGGSMSVSADDTTRVYKYVKSSSSLFPTLSTYKENIAKFWQLTNKKILSLTEFTDLAKKSPPVIKKMISSAFGVLDVIWDMIFTEQAGKMLADRTFRKLDGMGVIGSRFYVVRDHVLSEYKRESDYRRDGDVLPPIRTITLINVELDRVAGSPCLLLNTDELRRIKLDCSTVAVANYWVDRLLTQSTTRMHLAVTLDDIHTLQALLSQSAAIVSHALCQTDIVGLTPLHLALKPAREHTSSATQDTSQLSDAFLKIINATIQHSGAGVNVPDQNGWVPLHSAVYLQADAVVSKLLNCRGIDVNCRNADGNTPLHYFCQYVRSPNCKELLETYLKRGADVNAANHQGETPLHKAVFNSHVRALIMDFLLKHHAQVNAQTNFGETALHFAVHLGRQDLVRLLLINGASVTIVNQRGLTAFKIAVAEIKAEHPDGRFMAISLLLKEARRLAKFLQSPKLKCGHLIGCFLKENIFLDDLPNVQGEKGFERLGVKKPEEQARLVKAARNLGSLLKQKRAHLMGSSDTQTTEELIQQGASNEAIATIVSASSVLSQDRSAAALAAIEKKGSNPADIPDFNAQTTPDSADHEEWRGKLRELADGGVLKEFNQRQIEFLEELGSGTSGQVFKGIVKMDEKGDTPCAIKVLKASTSEREKDEFAREFKILNNLRHKYLVHFYGVQLIPALCLVMELCENGSLFDVLSKKRFPLKWSHVLEWAYQTCLAIDYLHNMKPNPILHRDLKSLNILLTKDFHTRLCDFGLSRHNSASNMETLGKLRGTMAYCAPEAYEGKQFDARGDVYSFGIILWEMAARIVFNKYQRPYAEYPKLNFDFQVIIQVAKKGLRPTIPPTTPAKLRELIQHCIKQNREERPSMAEVGPRIKAMQLEYDANTEAWQAAVVGEEESSSSSSSSDESSSSSGSSSSDDEDDDDDDDASSDMEIGNDDDEEEIILNETDAVLTDSGKVQLTEQPSSLKSVPTSEEVDSSQNKPKRPPLVRRDISITPREVQHRPPNAPPALTKEISSLSDLIEK